MKKTDREYDKYYAEILKLQLAYATEGNPLYPLNVPVSDLWAAMIRAIDLLEGSDDWIPCSERLPECYLTYDIFKRPSNWITDAVLVTVRSEQVSGVRYYVSTDIMTGNSKESVRWLMSCGYGGSAVYKQEIIAWMPLPKAYKEK